MRGGYSGKEAERNYDSHRGHRDAQPFREEIHVKSGVLKQR